MNQQTQDEKGENKQEIHLKKPPPSGDHFKKQPPDGSVVTASASLKDPPATATATTTTRTTTASPSASMGSPDQSGTTTTSPQEPNATTSTTDQEEADRQLAEALFAEELRQHELAGENLPVSSDPSQQSHQPVDQETILMLEQDFMPVLEVVWPEAYWPLDEMKQEKEKEQQQQGQDDEYDRKVPAVDTDAKDPDNSQEGLTEGQLYQRYLYQKLINLGAMDQESPQATRQLIRRAGPLRLIEFFQSEIIAENTGGLQVHTLEELVVFCQDDDRQDKTWQTIWTSLPLWDGPERIHCFHFLCKAVQVLGVEGLEELLFHAKEFGHTPSQILEIIYQRVKEEYQYMERGYDNDNNSNGNNAEEEKQDEKKPAAVQPQKEPPQQQGKESPTNDTASTSASTLSGSSHHTYDDDKHHTRSGGGGGTKRKKSESGHDEDDGGGKVGAVRDRPVSIFS